ncbi:TRAP transporter large permease [Agathobaculum sp. NTUH-O15-33]|nr:TRAP transporter large permease [Agathobaculum sp. NTUH-O15-33]WNX86093.1 TRAP transporter large permease [Agathobaculum sp. NTUH-O15-33]
MSMQLILVLVILFGLLLVGSPVVMAIGTAAMSYFVFKPDMLGNLMMYAHRLFTGMDSFIYICIPLFMLSGELMGLTGLMDRVVDFCRIFVGRLRGGVAYVNVLASMLFGGISGSALADIAALGPIEISMMEADGYERDFAAALTATSAIQGPVIPPSIPAVMFASLTAVSVGGMFIGGVVPGIMLGLGQILVIFFLARKLHFPKSNVRYSAKEALLITLKSFSAIFMIVIVLGGIISGVFTATEASAISVVYVLLLDLLFYHKLEAARFVVFPQKRGDRLGLDLSDHRLYLHYQLDLDHGKRAADDQQLGGRRQYFALSAAVSGQPVFPVQRHVDLGFRAARALCADLCPDLSANGHSSDPLWRCDGRKRHDRPDHAALWRGPVHRRQRQRLRAQGYRKGFAAVYRVLHRGAPADHLHPESCFDAAVAGRVHLILLQTRAATKRKGKKQGIHRIVGRAVPA